MTGPTLALHARRFRPPSPAEAQTSAHSLRTVALLHGFGQNSRCWTPFDNLLANDHRTVAVDLPGHGESRSQRGDLFETAALVAVAIEPSHLVGYSMGGRVALATALNHPQAVSSLTLISATAGIENPEDRTLRREADHSLADRIERIGIQAFTEEWLAGPLFSTLPRTARFEAERCLNEPSGVAAALRDYGTGSQPSLWDRVAELQMPVLIIAGALDSKFCAIAERLHSTVPNARLQIVANAGHSAHLEKPDDTAATVRAFLADQ